MPNMMPTPNPNPTAPSHPFVYQQQQQHPAYSDSGVFYRSVPAPLIPYSQSTSLAGALSPAVFPIRHHVATDSQRKSETPMTPAMTVGSCSSPMEMAEALTPASDMGAGTGAVAMVSHPDGVGKDDVARSAIKRTSVQMLEGCGPLVDDDAKKKAKMEGANVKPDTKGGLAVDKDGGEDDITEVDADGMRPVEHCVAEIMVEHETDDTIVSCHICKWVVIPSRFWVSP
jgi:hypothetical protein